MKVTPVSNYKPPVIPTRDYVDDNPEILNHIPRRWMSDAAILTALAGTAMLVTSCKGVTKPKVVMAGDPVRPQIISEVEARDIICNVAMNFGIRFDTSEKLQKTLKVPIIANKQNSMKNESFKLDGSDSKRRIYFEVISYDDFWELQDKKIISPGLSLHDTKGVASALRNKLRKAYPHGRYGVFYIPNIDQSDFIDHSKPYSERDYVKERNLAKAKAKQLLRAQVKDFIKWLKSEGVI